MLRHLALLALPLMFVACGGADLGAAPVREDPTADGQAVVFSGATIWDGSGTAAASGRHLVVRDGRIAGIVESVPADAKIVNVDGRWIVPGLVNAHGHVSGRWADDATTDPYQRVIADLVLYARYGVTGVLSLGDEPEAAFATRAAADSATPVHARLRLAGQVVYGETPAEAATIVRQNIERGADFIKIRVDDNLGTTRKMPWPAVQAAMNTARSAGLPVATHIFYLEDAARLLQMRTSLVAHSVRDQGVSEEFVQALLASGACYVPTLVREVSTFVYADRPDWFSDPFFTAAASRSEVERLGQPEHMAEVAASGAAKAYRAALVQARENLRIIADAGVPVAFGTDSGPAGRFPGYFEYLELQLMAEAGLSPREILLSATSVAARCAGFAGAGTLEPGNHADFVVLTGNPLDDIAAMRSIEDVYIGGRKVPR